ncbi:TetR family transcriptional regulator [Streptomyces sp. NRRL B-1568]|uniref:AcrR family transcriptional regulator n=1 Tax=Streptomyces olivoverticillatus TaxID=66427 RepID=A0A7W7PLD6_9ACTN|nr:TetR/AcrR family transcriptional regulator [Streptomyces olivoverticillatus]KJY42555.1 TetR family transcriptional regulator [Streptomyces sp. NRRL B-1568]MBB4892715.1 AcrR family transcriptional regulator [Streptomyces olivoverticillatus]
MAISKTPDSTRRSERSRRAILDAALDLVGETGYQKLTIEAIAARAGVGKQTIYRWWPSKAAVLLDAFLALGEDAAQGERELPDTGDLEADLKSVLRATVDELNSPVYDAPARALTAEGVVNAELGAQFVAQVLEPQLQLYVKRLRSAQEAGHLDPDVDPRIALELITGPLTSRWLLRTLPLTHDYADRVVELALRGISAR